MSTAIPTTSPTQTPARSHRRLSNVRPAATFDGHRLTQWTYFRGRVALAAMLRGLGVGPGDEVVVQAFTCVAVPEGVMATGATPVYADIEPDGVNLCPSDLAAKLTDATRAIVVQHTFGVPAQMDRIMDVANSVGVPVIGDCCHDFGSTFDTRTVGSFGVGSFYSFEWGKPIVAGLGGAAVANDPALEAKLGDQYSTYQSPGLAKQIQLELQYRAFQAVYRPTWYWHVRTAFRSLARLGAVAGNFRTAAATDEPSCDFSRRMSSRMLCRVEQKVQQLDGLRCHAAQVAERYRDEIRGVEHPVLPQSASVCYARYPLRVADKPRVLAAARRRGVELADWYTTAIHPLSPKQMGQVHYAPGSCPHAETRATQLVSLPTSLRVTNQYIDRVAKLFREL